MNPGLNHIDHRKNLQFHRGHDVVVENPEVFIQPDEWGDDLNPVVLDGESEPTGNPVVICTTCDMELLPEGLVWP